MKPLRFDGSLVPRVGLLAFVAGLAYLVLAPLYRLQAEAFRHGADGYHVAFGAPSIGRTLRYTVSLALGSLAIALVLGTALAWSARVCALVCLINS